MTFLGWWSKNRVILGVAVVLSVVLQWGVVYTTHQRTSSVGIMLDYDTKMEIPSKTKLIILDDGHDSPTATTTEFSSETILEPVPSPLLVSASSSEEKAEWKLAINRTALAYPIETWQTSPTTTWSPSWPLQDLDLKVFVYDSSTWPMGTGDAVRQCLLDHYLNATETPSPSNDNRITDLGIIQLFQTFPGRVYDPQQADVFVVPYPHASHCMSGHCRPGPYKQNCGGVPQSMIDDLVDKQLTYFRGNDTDRHLFILSSSHQLNKKLQMAALKFVIGGRKYIKDRPSQIYLRRMNPHHKQDPDQLGNFIMPYMNTHPLMQPNVIRSRSEDWWTSTTRPRKYSFVSISGGKNQKTQNDPRIYRRKFHDHLTRTHHKNNGTLGGLPYLIRGPGELRPDDMIELYQESTFCPCLPGDTVTQKRFFDVILSGCLPVVLKFPRERVRSNKTTDEEMVFSWHPFKNSLLENTFPFAHPKQFGGLPVQASLVNYSSFVVQVDLPADSGNIEEAMATLLLPSNQHELLRRQLEMSRVAPLLTYGLGPENAHRYEDAFSTLLRALKHHLETRLPPRKASRAD